MEFHEAGDPDSSMATYRLNSKIMSSGLIITGHASTQALQLVQALISSFVMKSPSKVLPSFNPGPPASKLFPTCSIRSRVSIMILRGESFFPVRLAGHSEVHRPHSVHE